MGKMLIVSKEFFSGFKSSELGVSNLAIDFIKRYGQKYLYLMSFQKGLVPLFYISRGQTENIL